MKKEHIVQKRAGPEEKKTILNSLNLLKDKKVLMVGDIGLDEYIHGQVRRISPEAPVPVLEVEKEEKRLGLGANISQNIASLGGIALTIGVVGQDEGAEVLKKIFSELKISTEGFVVDPSRPTTQKMRAMTGQHHLLRIDREKAKYLSQEIEQVFIERLEKYISSVDLVILQDYGKGVVSATLTQQTAQLCRRAGKRLLVDPHRSKGADFYFGVDLLKPNYDEAVALSGLRFDDLKDNPNKVYEVGRALQKKSGAKEIVLTRGKEGMTIFSGEEITEVPTYARRVFDVTGAGDTVISALALGLAAGLDLVHSCMLANFAAGVVVGKIGSVPCALDELVDYIQNHDRS